MPRYHEDRVQSIGLQAESVPEARHQESERADTILSMGCTTDPSVQVRTRAFVQIIAGGVLGGAF